MSPYVAAVVGVPGPISFTGFAWRRHQDGRWVTRAMRKLEQDAPFAETQRRVREGDFSTEAEAVDALRNAWKDWLAVARKDPQLRKYVKDHHGFRLVRDYGMKAAMHMLLSIKGVHFNYLAVDAKTGQVEEQGSIDTQQELRDELG